MIKLIAKNQKEHFPQSLHSQNIQNVQPLNKINQILKTSDFNNIHL